MKHGLQSHKNQTDGKMQIEKQKKISNFTDKDKAVCAISYIWILFFLPLVALKQAKFAKFHANQSLVLCIVSVVGAMIIVIFEQILTLLDVQMVGTVLGCIWSVVIVSAMLYGMITAAQGKMQELPVIGKMKIIK